MPLITCTDCGSEISDAAPACPKCGRPNSVAASTTEAALRTRKHAEYEERTSRRGKVALAFIAVVGALIWIGSRDGVPTSPAPADVAPASPPTVDDATAPPAPERQTFRTTANELFAAYEANEVATDDRMKGMVVQVTGAIQSIDKDFTDDVVLSLRTANEFEPARLSLVKSDKAQAASLRRGQVLTVACEHMSRVMGGPSGSDCQIIPQ